MPDITVQIHSRRAERLGAIQKLQHVVPSVALLTAGAQALMGGAAGVELAIAVAELITSSVLVVVFLKHLSKLRAGPPAHHHAHSVDWVDVWVAAALAVEVWEHWHVSGHIRRPTVLMAILTLFLGLMHGRVTGASHRRFALKITDDGIQLGARKFRRFSKTWDEIERIDISDTTVRMALKSGKMRKLNLTDLRNADEVRDAMRVAARHLSRA